MDNSYIGVSPIISIAGVMPGNSQMQWNTAYPNPDDQVTRGRIQNGVRRPGDQRPSISIAGVMPGTPQADSWVTAYPCPDEPIRQAELLRQRLLARQKVAELPKSRRKTPRAPSHKAA